MCHGRARQRHPFNLLVDNDRWTLIDWSTAVTADPHYDLAFTTLMLANPALAGPAPIRAPQRSSAPDSPAGLRFSVDQLERFVAERASETLR